MPRNHDELHPRIGKIYEGDKGVHRINFSYFSSDNKNSSSSLDEEDHLVGGAEDQTELREVI